MTYLLNYQHDIFVSYAHGPLRPVDVLGEWSRRLKNDLQAEIAYRLGTKDPHRQVDIWMDPTLAGNQPITDAIKDTVQRSALLVVIMSPFFFQTDWCANEVKWFSESTASSGGTAGRIFVVRQAPTQETCWPDTLRDSKGHVLKGYPFHTTQSTIDESDTFGWPAGSQMDAEYSQAVKRLAKDISRQLKLLAEAGDVVPPPVGRRVFLGFMHDTIEERDDLRAALTGAGLGVLPSAADDPVDEASLREALENHLEHADAMVLIANKYSGTWPKEEPGGFISLQIQKARERNIPCYLWLQVADHSEVRRPEYRNYLDALSTQAAEAGLALRHPELSDFVAYIVDRIGKDGMGEDDGGVEQLAVICLNRPADQEVGRDFEEAVRDTLFGICRSPHIFPFADPKGEQIKLANLGERIREADTVLLLCFDQDWHWARALLHELRRLSHARTGGKAKLLIAGPQDRQAGIYDARLHGFRTIDCVNLDPPQLKELLKAAILAAVASSGSFGSDRAHKDSIQ